MGYLIALPRAATMIVPSKNASWLSLLFEFNGTIFVKIRLRVLFVVLLSSVVTWAYLHEYIPPIGLKTGHVSLVALALSI
ncbi:MAG: bestrophin family ion channel, partial [Myxococcota bacterium]|nr:bestrophin family ion channel [Myxococcota bacterium]